MKKTVLKLDLHDDKDKRKALKTVSTLSGIDSIAIDMKEGKMTVIGAADPIVIAKKLQKSWKVEIFSVGAPTKEGGGGGGGGGGGEKKNNPNVDQMSELLKFYQAYPSQYYYAQRIEENPSNTCVIS